jgi:hypothetical protein
MYEEIAVWFQEEPFLQRNFHGVAKKHLACKLQVTSAGRGVYQNNGFSEAELSAGSGPPKKKGFFDG